MTASTERLPASLVLVLGGLSAIPPLATDMYLPALPIIAADLGSDEGSIQFSLMRSLPG